MPMNKLLSFFFFFLLQGQLCCSASPGKPPPTHMSSHTSTCTHTHKCSPTHWSIAGSPPTHASLQMSSYTEMHLTRTCTCTCSTWCTHGTCTYGEDRHTHTFSCIWLSQRWICYNEYRVIRRAPLQWVSWPVHVGSCLLCERRRFKGEHSSQQIHRNYCTKQTANRHRNKTLLQCWFLKILLAQHFYFNIHLQ